MQDQLKALQGVALAGLIVTGLAIGVGLYEVATRAPIHTTMSAVVEPEVPPGVQADPEGQIDVVIESPTPRQQLLHGLSQTPTTLLVFTFLAMLARLLRRARHHDPFSRQTVRALRWMGVCLVAGVPATAIEAASQFLLAETLNPDRFTATMPVPYLWVLGGVTCFALAAITQRGVAMRAELETLV